MIDVSSYPADMQQRYALFTHKCSRCHSLEKPLQARVGKNGWADYVRRMSRHPGAGISERDQREIAAFLQYHAQREEARRQ
jgi:cytochrome c2